MFRMLLALLCLIFPIAAHADWHEASTAHFIVYADERPERLQRFASDLERFDQAVRYLGQIPDDPVGKANRVTVYMLDDAGDVGKLAGDQHIAGLYIPRAGGSLALVPHWSSGDEYDLNSQAVLFHEYTHHLMLGAYAHAAFPAWMVEGLAEFHATARLNRDGSVMFGTAPRYRAWGLLSGNPLPLERILASDLAKLNPEQRDALYGRGWLLTHYLTFEPSRKGQLRQYVTDINAGKTPAQAAAAFGDLSVLHRELERYISKRRITSVTVAAPALHIGQVTIRKLTSGEAATMNIRIQTKRGTNKKNAPAVYAAAKKAAGPFPNDPGAQLVLAETAFDAGDFAASEAAADRAIAADPNAIDGFVYKAKSQIAVAAAAKDFARPRWDAIRKIIATANHLDPDDPEPLILYYRSFTESGVAPTKNAKAGLYRAFELCPQDLGLRMNVARLYLKDGDPQSARTLLKPLAYDPHSGDLAAVASKMIADIDAGAPKPAKASPAP